MKSTIRITNIQIAIAIIPEASYQASHGAAKYPFQSGSIHGRRRGAGGRGYPGEAGGGSGGNRAPPVDC